MFLIGDINLQVYPLYNSLCPTFYHHYNCPYYVSNCDRGNLKNPVEGHYNTLFPLKIITTKVCPRYFLYMSYFYLDFIYIKKNPSNAIVRTIFFTFHMYKNPSHVYVSGKKW
jgi:hypothetical protein